MPEIRVPEINSVSLAGRLTRDPDLRFTESGLAILSFSMAINRRYKDKSGEWKDDVSFIEGTVFGKAAEPISKRLAKGSAVFVEGRIKSNAWEDKDGTRRSRITVSCDRLQVLTKREEGAAPAGDSGDNTDDVPF